MPTTTALVKELESVYENVLDKQLATPAGLALIQAKITALTPAKPAPATA